MSEVVGDAPSSEQIEQSMGVVKVAHQHSDMGQEHDGNAKIVKHEVLVHFIYLPA